MLISAKQLQGPSAKEHRCEGGVWDILQLPGQTLMKDGQAIEGAEPSLEHLRTTYDGFQTMKLQAYARLGNG